MRVDVIHARPEPERVGSIFLLDGVAAFEPSVAWISELQIVVPGHPEQRVTPKDGRRYLRALLFNLRGTHCWAEVQSPCGRHPPGARWSGGAIRLRAGRMVGGTPTVSSVEATQKAIGREPTPGEGLAVLSPCSRTLLESPGRGIIPVPPETRKVLLTRTIADAPTQGNTGPS